MSQKGRYLELDNWRIAQEAASADRVADNFRKQVGPKTPGQEVFWSSLRTRKLTLCVGPAGTGKTMLSCALAAQLLKTKQVETIILTRPLVQCGRGYGFLPGDRREKVEFFLRPMLDYLGEFLTTGEVEKQIRLGGIKLEPLEDMRGSTYKKTFLICDEGQNADFSQLHMLLTRYGPGSKFAILGDTSRTQTDALHRGGNPLKEVISRIESRGGNKDIGVVRLTRKDILRDGLVQWIDETLGDDAVESWQSLKCPKCAAKLWYDNGDERAADFSDVEELRCWSCQSGIHLWTGEDQWKPAVGAVASPTETFPDKP